MDSELTLISHHPLLLFFRCLLDLLSFNPHVLTQIHVTGEGRGLRQVTVTWALGAGIMAGDGHLVV